MSARASSTVEGPTGLLNVPTAEVVQEGKAEIGTGRFLNDYLEANRDFIARTWFFSIGYLPNLELTGRFSDYPTREDSKGTTNYQDRSASLKYRLWHDDRWTVSAGLTDFSGESVRNRSAYGVVTYHGVDDLEVTAGTGTKGYEGVFGGVKWSPAEYVSLIAEHDTDSFNYGVEVRPLKDFSLKGGMVNDHGAFTATYTFPLDPRGKESKCCPVELGRCSVEYADDCEMVNAVRDALVAESFENVLVGSDGDTLYVEFENRRFVEQVDALAVATSIAATHSGPHIVNLIVSPKIEDIPQVTIHTGVDEYLEFLRTPGSCGAIRVTPHRHGSYPASTVFATEGNRKNLHTDLQLRYVNAVEITRPGQPSFRSKNGLGLEEQVFLGRGLKFKARQDWPFQNDLDEKTDAISRDAYLQYFDAWTPELYVQANAGMMGRDKYGVVAEAGYYFNDERFKVGARMASFAGRENYEDALGLDEATVLGELEYYEPSLDWTVRALGGSFEYQDEGLRFESNRYFGPVELTLFAYDTDDTEPHGGFRFFVPLPWYGEQRHGAHRAVGAPLFGWQYRTDSESYGRVPQTGYDLNTLRQRLRPEYVRAHLDDFRRAVSLFYTSQ